MIVSSITLYNCMCVSKMAQRRDPTGLRLQRIQRMHRMVSGGEKVDLTRFLATCEYQIGLTRKKTREYLTTLEDLGFIEVNDLEGWIREVVKE